MTRTLLTTHPRDGRLHVFEIRYQGEPIGHSALETFDDGMGVAAGAFAPAPGYERVRPVFRLFAEATGETPEHPLDREKLARFLREFEALDLELIAPSGARIVTTFIQVFDSSGEGVAGAYEVAAQIRDRAAWEAARAAAS